MKKFFIVPAVSMILIYSAGAQVSGISASKLATFNASAVGHKTIEFEPSFGSSFSTKFFNENGGIDNIRLLYNAIDSFKGAAVKFEAYYQQLEKRVGELDLELQNKHEELKINLKEKEDVKNHLKNILESLTTGVVVMDLNGKINTFNHAAEKITGLILKKVIGKEFDKVFGIDFFGDSNLDFKSIKDIEGNKEIEAEICNRNREIHY